MATKWSSTTLGKTDSSKDLEELFKDEYAVILLQGRNVFGDMIYSYVKVGLSNIKPLYTALQSGQNFNPSDFGMVVAAGKGEPAEDVKAEIAMTYQMLEPIKTVSFPAVAQAAAEKKAWDEY